METILAFVIGGLYAAGIYMMLRRSIVKLAIGLSLISNASNLLIFTAAQLIRANAPLIPEGETQPPEPFADPLPQALILTAIVISFSVLAFTLVLIHRAYDVTGTDDLDNFKETET